MLLGSVVKDGCQSQVWLALTCHKDYIQSQVHLKSLLWANRHSLRCLGSSPLDGIQIGLQLAASFRMCLHICHLLSDKGLQILIVIDVDQLQYQYICLPRRYTICKYRQVVLSVLLTWCLYPTILADEHVWNATILNLTPLLLNASCANKHQSVTSHWL